MKPTIKNQIIIQPTPIKAPVSSYNLRIHTPFKPINIPPLNYGIQTRKKCFRTEIISQKRNFFPILFQISPSARRRRRTRNCLSSNSKKIFGRPKTIKVKQVELSNEKDDNSSSNSSFSYMEDSENGQIKRTVLKETQDCNNRRTLSNSQTIFTISSTYLNLLQRFLKKHDIEEEINSIQGKRTSYKKKIISSFNNYIGKKLQKKNNIVNSNLKDNRERYTFIDFKMKKVFCNCQKTNCNLNYCQCRKEGVNCSSICSCVNCCNM